MLYLWGEILTSLRDRIIKMCLYFHLFIPFTALMGFVSLNDLAQARASQLNPREQSPESICFPRNYLQLDQSEFIVRAADLVEKISFMKDEIEYVKSSSAQLLPAMAGKQKELELELAILIQQHQQLRVWAYLSFMLGLILIIVVCLDLHRRMNQIK